MRDDKGSVTFNLPTLRVTKSKTQVRVVDVAMSSINNSPWIKARFYVQIGEMIKEVLLSMEYNFLRIAQNSHSLVFF